MAQNQISKSTTIGTNPNPVPAIIAGKSFIWVPDNSGKYSGVSTKFNESKQFAGYSNIQFVDRSGKVICQLATIPATIPTLGTYVTRANKLLANPTIGWESTTPTRGNNSGNSNNSGNNWQLSIDNDKIKLTDAKSNQFATIDKSGNLSTKLNPDYNNSKLIDRISTIYTNFVINGKLESVNQYLPKLATATIGKYSINFDYSNFDIVNIKSQLAKLMFAENNFDYFESMKDDSNIKIIKSELDNFINWRDSINKS